MSQPKYKPDDKLSYAFFNDACEFHKPAPKTSRSFAQEVFDVEDVAYWEIESLSFLPYSYEEDHGGELVEATSDWQVNGQKLPVDLIPETVDDFLALCKLLKITPKSSNLVPTYTFCRTFIFGETGPVQYGVRIQSNDTSSDSPACMFASKADQSRFFAALGID